MLLRRQVFLILIAFLHLTFSVSAQDQKVADSLAVIYSKGSLTDTQLFELLLDLSFNEVRDLQLSLRYAEELIDIASLTGNDLYMHSGYFQKGNKKRLLGDIDEALDAYFKSVEAAHNANHAGAEGNAYGAIADIYSISDNHDNAILYYNKSIATLRQANDSIGLASVLLNNGEHFLINEMFDSALIRYQESELLFDRLDHPIGKAYSLGNIGMVYANVGRRDLAEQNITRAIRVLEDNGDYYPICVYLISMCDIYQEKGDESTALAYAQRSLDLAEQYGLKEQIADANLKLSELYEQDGNQIESYKYYKDYIAYRDSVNNIQMVQKMADQRTDFEVSRKQIEVDLLEQKRQNQKNTLTFLLIILGLGVLILSTLFWNYRVIQREKKKSESLLLNILPAETAIELKQNGKVNAVRFDEVTVLFTDFVGFTKTAEFTDPEQLVRSIDFYFRHFDEIVAKHGLEKIKTIGDAYMCAGGLPVPNKAHAINVIEAAKEMAEFVNGTLNAEDGLDHFEIRIGVHTGPVVAGIVGIKKWAYDIWGDTVNVASRMESKSVPGRINISESTYHLVKNEYPCEYRGEIEIKHRGTMKMYFLSEIVAV